MKSKVQLSPEESIPPLWRNRLCWLPFIGALITFIPTLIVILNLWKGLHLEKFTEIADLKTIALFAGYLNARTFYFLALFFWAVTSITTIMVTGYVIWQYVKGASNKQRSAWAVLLLIVISATVIAIFALEIKVEFYEHLFKPTIDWIQLLESRVELVANLVKTMGTVGILMVVAAFAASLYTAPKRKSVSVDEVASQRKNLLLTLYSGTALLISGVLATFAYVRIPSVLLSAEPVDESVPLAAPYMEEVAVLITITFGVTFTLSLAGAYFPASIVISERAKSLAARFGKAQPDFDSQKWLEEQNLGLPLCNI